MSPDSSEFLDFSRETFSFLEKSGFCSRLVSKPTFDAVIFEGSNVVLTISIDKRENCIDFDVESTNTNNRAVGFYHYVINRHGYRGSLAEFKDTELAESWQRTIKCYAVALRQLAPELTCDKLLSPHSSA